MNQSSFIAEFINYSKYFDYFDKYKHYINITFHNYINYFDNFNYHNYLYNLPDLSNLANFNDFNDFHTKFNKYYDNLDNYYIFIIISISAFILLTLTLYYNDTNTTLYEDDEDETNIFKLNNHNKPSTINSKLINNPTIFNLSKLTNIECMFVYMRLKRNQLLVVIPENEQIDNISNIRSKIDLSQINKFIESELELFRLILNFQTNSLNIIPEQFKFYQKYIKYAITYRELFYKYKLSSNVYNIVFDKPYDIYLMFDIAQCVHRNYVEYVNYEIYFNYESMIKYDSYIDTILRNTLNNNIDYSLVIKYVILDNIYF